jgi:hypothetical protein
MLLSSLIAALAAPATVLDHTVDVKVDWGRRLTSTQTWKVRIDDPAACVAGLIAPPGLDGAVDGGAMVLQDLFIVPADAVAGDVFTLTATERGGRGPHSGIFSTAPTLPVEQATVTVTAQGNQPLTVWADPLGDPVWSTRRGKSATITWSDIPPDSSGRVVWSTWSDWLEAGEALRTTVDGKLVSKRVLGRDLAGDLDASNLPEIVRRTLRHVALDLEATGGWAEARDAGEIAASRKGTAAERGVVLLSMLREAGYDATPAQIRRASAQGVFPVTVPSPDMLDTPMIHARDRTGRVIWIDPASDSVAVPAVPAAMVGATAWVPGGLPSRRIAPGVVDGQVLISTTATVDTKGDVTWSADVHATGTALEAIRRLLRPLDASGQEQALRRLVSQARPDLERFSVQTSGTVDPFKTFSIRLSGYDEGVFTPEADGMRGTVVPVLGAAMAAWLPPNIRVQELLDLKPPASLPLAAHTRPGPAYDPSAQIDRQAGRNGGRLRIDVDAIRPYAATTSALDAAASTFYAERAQEGVEVLLFPPASKKVVKQLGTLDRPAAEQAALQALLWWSVDNDKGARKVLKKALKRSSAAELLSPMSAWVDARDARPWRALLDLTPAEDRDAQIALLTTLAETNPALAHELASPLFQHLDPAVATQALLIGMAHAPSKELRNSLASRVDDIDDALVQQVQVEVAAFDLDQGVDPQTATAKVTDDSPRGRMLQLAGVARTLPRETLLAEVDALRDEAPTDPRVAARGASLLTRAGFRAEALEAGLDAARLAHDDPALWHQVTVLAARAGNLRLALDAAVRASDLAADTPAHTERLHHLATLARDEEHLALAAQRDPSLENPEDPLALDALSGIATQDELLAVLQFHDDEVLDNPVYLALRAQLRADAGLRDEAARDGIQLTRLHGDPQGRAIAFAATAGRVFGTGAIDLLDDVTDPTARLTRLDYRLITGSGDARADARVLRDEPRGQEVLLALGDPTAAAAKVDGWPTDLTDVRTRPPAGYRVNPILSAAKGVSAFSHADRQLAVVVVHGVTTALPPPLSTLFSVGSPPLATDADGAEILALRDGYLPLFAARLQEASRTVYGLGFTPEAARRALGDAPD